MRLAAGDCVVVFDFSDGREGNFDYLAVGHFNLDAGGGQCLSGFHTPNRSPDSPPIGCDDFYVVLAI